MSERGFYCSFLKRDLTKEAVYGCKMQEKLDVLSKR